MPFPRFLAAGAIGNDPRRHFGPRHAWLALSVVAAGVIAIVALLPAALVLPAVSMLLVTLGFALAGALALAGYRLAGRGGAVGGFDIAGAFLLVGFTAALLSDAGAALALVERWLAEGANSGR
jgi:hypothetical protein